MRVHSIKPPSPRRNEQLPDRLRTIPAFYYRFDFLTVRDYGRSTTFTVSLGGVTDMQAAGIHEICATSRFRPRERPTIPTTRFVLHVCHEQPNNPLKC
jgi:hypothetical protein